MQIEAGKYYRTRDGQKVGPAERAYDGLEATYRLSGRPYDASGIAIFAPIACNLTEEWSDEPAKPELPKFDVRKLVRLYSTSVNERRCGSEFNYMETGLLAVAEYARDITLNPPKDPVKVLAEKLHAHFKSGSRGWADLARHILETYPDAHERL